MIFVKHSTTSLSYSSIDSVNHSIATFSYSVYLLLQKLPTLTGLY